MDTSTLTRTQQKKAKYTIHGWPLPCRWVQLWDSDRSQHTHKVFRRGRLKPEPPSTGLASSQSEGSLLSIFAKSGHHHRAEWQQLTHAPAHPQWKRQPSCRFFPRNLQSDCYIMYNATAIILFRVITLMRTIRVQMFSTVRLSSWAVFSPLRQPYALVCSSICYLIGHKCVFAEWMRAE